MKLICLFVLAFLFVGCSSVQQHHDNYFGLTQAQLAAKVGFPLRVYMLDSKARGGPGILFWVYYQRSRAGIIEEKQFAFGANHLRVGSISQETDPARFLSLDQPKDFGDIYKYNAAHGL